MNLATPFTWPNLVPVLEWTSTLPVKPGWYWVRDSPYEDEWCVLPIAYGNSNDKNVLFIKYNSTGRWGRLDELVINHEFAGPIPFPVSVSTS